MKQRSLLLTSVLLVGVLSIFLIKSSLVQKNTNLAAATVVGAVAATQPAPVLTAPKIVYQYKLLSNVDGCLLSALGLQGWQAIQFGNSQQGSIPYPPDVAYLTNGSCAGSMSKFSIYFDWVLFQLGPTI